MAFVSDDIRGVVDWEIANNENSIASVTYPHGPPVVCMTRPLKQWLRGVQRDVPPTLTWFEYRDSQYGEEYWCAGFKSSESGHTVSGPLR
jgi:hypothetical protein